MCSNVVGFRSISIWILIQRIIIYYDVSPLNDDIETAEKYIDAVSALVSVHRKKRDKQNVEVAEMFCVVPYFSQTCLDLAFQLRLQQLYKWIRLSGQYWHFFCKQYVEFNTGISFNITEVQKKGQGVGGSLTVYWIWRSTGNAANSM